MKVMNRLGTVVGEQAAGVHNDIGGANTKRSTRVAATVRDTTVTRIWLVNGCLQRLQLFLQLRAKDKVRADTAKDDD